MYVEMQDRVCSTCALSYYSRAVEVYISSNISLYHLVSAHPFLDFSMTLLIFHTASISNTIAEGL